MPYGDDFFVAQADESLRSARVVVPIVMEMLRPKSVVDIGCGIGAWLRAFAECGVEDGLGLDGDYVDRAKLVIEPGQFRMADLSRPSPIGRRYDLAVCLEVAEHLPEAVSAALIRVLTTAAPLVLFSAAIPGQGGTHHINEQWPHFWRRLFLECGYVRLDPFRSQIWQNKVVAPWYRQNLYLFASRETVAGSPSLQEEEARLDSEIELVSSAVLARYQSFTSLLAEIPRAFWRSVKQRLR